MSRLHNNYIWDDKIDYLILDNVIQEFIVVHEYKIDYTLWPKTDKYVTMSQLKKDPRKLTTISFGIKYVFEQPIHFSNNKLMYLWEKPFQIHAITSFDQDYSYEGNQYGDTSNFYIIGTLISDKSK